MDVQGERKTIGRSEDREAARRHGRNAACQKPHCSHGGRLRFLRLYCEERRDRGEHEKHHRADIDQSIRKRRPARAERSRTADTWWGVLPPFEGGPVDIVRVGDILMPDQIADVLAGRVGQLVPPCVRCDLFYRFQVEPMLAARTCASKGARQRTLTCG